MFLQEYDGYDSCRMRARSAQYSTWQVPLWITLKKRLLIHWFSPALSEVVQTEVLEAGTVGTTKLGCDMHFCGTCPATALDAAPISSPETSFTPSKNATWTPKQKYL